MSGQNQADDRPGFAAKLLEAQTPQTPWSLRRIYLAVARPIVPRTPSLELYVLPIGGGQLINFPKAMELRGIEPLTSAVRLQRSPS